MERSRLDRTGALLAPWLLALSVTTTARPVLAQDAAGSGVTAPTGAIETTQGALGDAIRTWLEPHAPSLLRSFAGNELWRYAALIVTVLLFTAMRKVVLALVVRGLERVTRKTENTIDDALIDAIDPPLGWFVVALGAYVSLLWLSLPPGVRNVADQAYRIVVVLIVGWALLRMVDIFTGLVARVAARTETELDDYLVPLVGRVVRVIIVAMVVVVGLQELGFNVAGVLAGLGVGGLAFALAAQDTVANWFGALMLYTDRPFEVGDWIKTSSLEGVVEDIGLRSTRIRTFSKTVVTVPNRQLANDVIENFSRMPKRRVSFKLGVTYSTTPAMMEEALERVKDILRAHHGVDQDFWLVKFSDFEDSALAIMVYYFTATTDWDKYLTIRQDVNLRIMRSLHDIGVQVAFPSRSIYVEEVDAAETRRLDDNARRLFASRTPRDEAHESQIAPSDDAKDI